MVEFHQLISLPRTCTQDTSTDECNAIHELVLLNIITNTKVALLVSPAVVGCFDEVRDVGHKVDLPTVITVGVWGVVDDIGHLLHLTLCLMDVEEYAIW